MLRWGDNVQIEGSAERVLLSFYLCVSGVWVGGCGFFFQTPAEVLCECIPPLLKARKKRKENRESQPTTTNAQYSLHLYCDRTTTTKKKSGLTLYSFLRYFFCFLLFLFLFFGGVSGLFVCLRVRVLHGTQQLVMFCAVHHAVRFRRLGRLAGCFWVSPCPFC